MSEIRNFEIFFYNDLLICPDCSKNFKLHKQVYNIDGIPLYVLYEYDEFLERLFFQYKEQRDVVLKDIFLCEHLYLKKTFKNIVSVLYVVVMQNVWKGDLNQLLICIRR